MKIFWFTSDILLVRVQRIRSTTIPVLRKSTQRRKALKHMHIFRLSLHTAKKGSV